MGEYPRGKQGQGQDLFACGESALWHHAVNQPRGGGGSRHREMGLAFHARWFVRIGGKWISAGGLLCVRGHNSVALIPPTRVRGSVSRAKRRWKVKANAAILSHAPVSIDPGRLFFFGAQEAHSTDDPVQSWTWGGVASGYEQYRSAGRTAGTVPARSERATSHGPWRNGTPARTWRAAHWMDAVLALLAWLGWVQLSCPFLPLSLSLSPHGYGHGCSKIVKEGTEHMPACAWRSVY
jgi:hypothetical protein